MTPSNQCVKEARELRLLAQSLLAKGDRTGAERLEAHRSELLQLGLSSDELRAKYAAALSEETRGSKPKIEYRAAFDKYLAGRSAERELRDLLAGQQSITYTQGAAGGFLIPHEYDDTLREANLETSPVVSDDVVDFQMTGSMTLQPSRVSGYDLSSIIADIVAETTVENPQVSRPVVGGGQLRADITFRVNLTGSIEGETDIPDFASKVVRASQVALARKVGRSILAGRGGTDINGIVKQLGSPTVSNQTAGKIQSTDLSTTFFSVDRWYREQKKCGWLMSDAVYRKVRDAVDNQGRPLLDFVNDKEQILGKPVYVCPDLATTFSSIGLTGAILFGDLSHIVVRASRPTIRRKLEVGQADITRGEALYTAIMRADATLFDPSNGAAPPLVLAAIN